MLWLNPDIRLLSACLVKTDNPMFCSSKFLWIFFSLAWEPNVALASHWNLNATGHHRSLKNKTKNIEVTAWNSPLCFAVHFWIWFLYLSRNIMTSCIEGLKDTGRCCSFVSFTVVTGVSSKSCNKCNADRAVY